MKFLISAAMDDIAYLSEDRQRWIVDPSDPKVAKFTSTEAHKVVEEYNRKGKNVGIVIETDAIKAYQNCQDEWTKQSEHAEAERRQDEIDAIREDAFRAGVAHATKTIGWCVDEQPDWYDDAWADMEICRVKPWHEAGDMSVGIPDSEGVGLSQDQSGTLIEKLVNERDEVIKLLKNLRLHLENNTSMFNSEEGKEFCEGFVPVNEFLNRIE